MAPYREENAARDIVRDDGIVPGAFDHRAQKHVMVDFNPLRSFCDPMYGPAVRCKRFFVDLVGDGLASMYPASRWSVAPGHHGYQRACDLISR